MFPASRSATASASLSTAMNAWSLASSSRLPSATRSGAVAGSLLLQLRPVSTTSVAHAAAKKGKAPAKPVKKQGGSFNKSRAAKKIASGPGGSAGSVKAKGGAFAFPAARMGPAPDLSSLEELTPEYIIDGDHSLPVRFPDSTIEAFEAFGLPRNLEREFADARHIGTVVRKDSVRLVQKLKEVAQHKKSSKDASFLLTGSGGSGKSTLLAQAVSSALQDDSIVIYVPRAILLINSTSQYAYDTESKTYHQPALSSQILRSIASVNSRLLATIASSADVKVGGQEFKTLADLVQFGSKNETNSVEVLEHVLEVLATQKEHNVLLAIDDAQALFMETAYRTPDYSLLQSYALSVPRLLLDYISGRKQFANGAIVAALSMSSPHHQPPPELYAALANTLPSPKPISPFDKLDPFHFEHAKTLQVMPVGEKLSVLEAYAFMALLRDQGAVPKTKVTDELFLTKFAESGGHVLAFTRGFAKTLTV